MLPRNQARFAVAHRIERKEMRGSLQTRDSVVRMRPVPETTDEPLDLSKPLDLSTKPKKSVPDVVRVKTATPETVPHTLVHRHRVDVHRKLSGAKKATILPHQSAAHPLQRGLAYVQPQQTSLRPPTIDDRQRSSGQPNIPQDNLSPEQLRSIRHYAAMQQRLRAEAANIAAMQAQTMASGGDLAMARYAFAVQNSIRRGKQSPPVGGTPPVSKSPNFAPHSSGNGVAKSSHAQRKHTSPTRMASVNPIQRSVPQTELQTYLTQRRLAEMSVRRGLQSEQDILRAYRSMMNTSSRSTSHAVPQASLPHTQVKPVKSPLPTAETQKTDKRTTSQVTRHESTPPEHSTAHRKHTARSSTQRNRVEFAALVKAREQAMIKQRRELLLQRQHQLIADANNNRKYDYVRREKERAAMMSLMASRHFSEFQQKQDERMIAKTQNVAKVSHPPNPSESSVSQKRLSVTPQQKRDKDNASPTMPVLVPHKMYSQNTLPLPVSSRPSEISSASIHPHPRPELLLPNKVLQSGQRLNPDLYKEISLQKAKATSPKPEIHQRKVQMTKDAPTEIIARSTLQHRSPEQMMHLGSPPEKTAQSRPNLHAVRKGVDSIPVRDRLVLARMSDDERYKALLHSRYAHLAKDQDIRAKLLQMDPFSQGQLSPTDSRISEHSSLTVGDKIDRNIFHTIGQQHRDGHEKDLGKTGKFEHPSRHSHSKHNPRHSAGDIIDLTADSPPHSPVTNTVKSPVVEHNVPRLLVKRKLDHIPPSNAHVFSQHKLQQAQTTDELTPTNLSFLAKRIVSSTQQWLKKYLMREKESNLPNNTKPPHNEQQRNELQTMTTPVEKVANSDSDVGKVPDLPTIKLPGPVCKDTVPDVKAEVTESNALMRQTSPPTPTTPDSHPPALNRTLSHDPRKKLLASMGSGQSSPESSPTSSPIANSSPALPEDASVTVKHEAVEAETTIASLPRKRPLEIDRLENSTGFVAGEIKRTKRENDLMQADTALLGREERALQRAIIRFNEMEMQKTSQSVEDASAETAKMSNRGTHRRRRRKLSKYRRRVRAQRSVSSSLFADTAGVGRRRGRPRLSSVPSKSEIYFQSSRRNKFQDFVPTILETRTRNADHIRNYRSLHDARNARYELEIEKEQAKILERRQRQRECNNVSTVTDGDGDSVFGEDYEPPRKRRSRKSICGGREKKAEESPDQAVSVKQEVVDHDVPSCSYDFEDERDVDSSQPLRVVLDDNSPNHIKMKFVNIRSAHKSGDTQAGATGSRRRGRPPKDGGKHTTKNKNLELPDSPPPPKLEIMPTCDKENNSDYEDYVQEPDSDVIDGDLTSSEFFHVPVIRPEPPPEMKRFIINKKLGETILHRAATLGNEEIAKYCVDYRVIEVNAKDNAGYTPLHESCVHGHLAVAKYLLSHGADVNASAADGTRPIHDAVDHDRVELVRLLLAYGADPLLATYSGRKTMKLALSRSNEMKTLLFGYLRDVNGDRTKLVDSPERKLDYQWTFNGSCSVLDDNRNSGFDILAGVPGPESKSGDADHEVEDEGIFFELSDQPLLPSYHLQLGGQDRFRNWMLLNQVTERLSLSREELRTTYPEIQPITLSAEQFDQSVRESQVSRHTIADMTLMCDSNELDDKKGETVVLVEVTDRLRKLLGIDVEYVR